MLGLGLERLRMPRSGRLVGALSYKMLPKAFLPKADVSRGTLGRTTNVHCAGNDFHIEFESRKDSWTSISQCFSSSPPSPHKEGFVVKSQGKCSLNTLSSPLPAGICTAYNMLTSIVREKMEKSLFSRCT